MMLLESWHTEDDFTSVYRLYIEDAELAKIGIRDFQFITDQAGTALSISSRLYILYLIAKAIEESRGGSAIDA